MLSYDPATNTELGTITGYMGTSRNLFTIDASTEPAGTYLIEKVTSLKSEYNPGDRANFMVYGIETIDKSPTENKEGFAIQSYVFNDLGDDKLSLSKMWLSSNPESSYNGNYDINSGSWIFDMFVPMIPGKYIQRSSLFVLNQIVIVIKIWCLGKIIR